MLGQRALLSCGLLPAEDQLLQSGQRRLHGERIKWVFFSIYQQRYSGLSRR